MKNIHTSPGADADEDYYIEFESETELERLQSESLFGPVTCGMIFGYLFVSNSTASPYLLCCLLMSSYVLIRLFTKNLKANLIAIPAALFTMIITAWLLSFVFSAIN